jgi:DNA-binding transcriptional MerR regulator
MDIQLNMMGLEDLELKVVRVADEVEAIRQVDHFRQVGYTLDEIYVLTYDQRKTEDMANVTEANMPEEGVTSAIANLFRSKEGRLRAKMESLGLSKAESKRYEDELDEGGYLIIGKPNSMDGQPPHDESTFEMPPISPHGFR